MIVIDNFNQVLAQIETERGIERDIIISAIEQALVSACRRKLGEEAVLNATLDNVTGEARIFQHKTVVETVEDEDLEITLAEAKKIEKSAKIDGEVVFDVTPDDFGRIAAQTAKQVIIQRIREAEKNVIFDEFQEKVGTIITGTIQRIENRNYLINLGRVEAMLFYRDVIPGETFQNNEKVRLYVADIEKGNRGAMIQISRTHPGFLKQLFELEIPEVQDNIIDVMSVSREPGMRAKVAVKTNNPAIGAVGTCVGHMGSRIQSIIRELGQEKIDVLEWNENPTVFISNALKPAKISRVILTNPEEKTAVVVVENDQLSLAIGKNGINVRLSVKLTGWKLDILSESEFAEKEDEIVGENQLSIVDKIRLQKEEEAGNGSLSNLSDDTEADGGTLLANIAAQKAAEASKKSEENPEENQIAVSELAEALTMDTDELIAQAKGFGLEIEDADSMLTSEQVQSIKENIK